MKERSFIFQMREMQYLHFSHLSTIMHYPLFFKTKGIIFTITKQTTFIHNIQKATNTSVPKYIHTSFFIRPMILFTPENPP